MRKIILLMHVSLDGFVAGPGGDMSWIRLSDDLWEHVKEVTDSADVALFGANTYKMMESYWPTAAVQPNATQHDVDHAAWVNNAIKLLFSTTRQETEWEHTTIIREHIAEKMAEYKNQAGRNLLMLGSPTLAHHFMELGLIDEFFLNINPVVIGSGKPLFSATEINLTLKSTRVFQTGVVGLQYAKA